MTIRIVFLIIVSVFISLTAATGQPQEVKTPDAGLKRNKLGLSLGFHHSQSQDLLFSPLIYDGQSLSAIKKAINNREIFFIIFYLPTYLNSAFVRVTYG